LGCGSLRTVEGEKKLSSTWGTKEGHVLREIANECIVHRKKEGMGIIANPTTIKSETTKARDKKGKEKFL